MRRTSVFLTIAFLAGLGIGFFARSAGTGTLQRRDTHAADLAAIERLHRADIEATLTQDSSLLCPQRTIRSPPRWHSQLLPHESTFRSGGSHQRQHQNPLSKGPWLQESRLSAAQGSAHGGHQDRIHRSSESRLKCESLRILVQSHKVRAELLKRGY